MIPAALRQCFRLLSLHCADVSALVSRGLDADLPRPERHAVELHLAICPSCRRFRRHLMIMRQIFSHLGAQAPAPSLPAAARTRIKNILQAECERF